MNSIGEICGIPFFVSEHAGTRERVFTRKQTRKFKNKRWCKKYIKKYSYETFTPGAFMIQNNQALLMHPDVYKKVKDKIDGQKYQFDPGNLQGSII